LSTPSFFSRRPRLVNLLAKAAIAALFLGLLWYDLIRKDDFQHIKTAFWAEVLRGQNNAWLWLTLALMPLNWAAEAMKWLQTVRRVERMNFGTAYKSTLAGVTTSLFLPNRTGDFGGRILFLKAKHRWRGVFATFVGSWAQQLVLLTFGWLGFNYFLLTLWKADTIILQAVLGLGAVAVAALFFLFLNIEMLVPFCKKIRFLYRFPRLIENTKLFRQYTRRELGKTLWWAFVRYVIYGLQYYCMLRFFGIDVPLLRGSACIATIYLLQTSIPLPPIVGLLARGEVALQIWGLFSANSISILATTFSLWVINLIIPAFVGLVFIFQTNFFKTFGFEKKPISDKETHKELSENNNSKY
jgi:Lysylphosphatidylglycerol synthase TM region